MSVCRRPFVLVALLGLMAVLLPSPVAAVVEGTVGRVTVERVSGASRIATAIAVSAETFPSADTVVISRADQFADALVGAVVAAENDAPILLVDSTSTPAEVLDEITRLGATEAVVLGGTGAVSEAAATAISDLGVTVRRIAGTSRFDTAARAATEASDTSRVFVANGGNFPDALSVAPYAAFLGNPIVLANAESLPQETADLLTTIAPSEIVVIGGTAAVDNAVFGELGALAGSIRRIAGVSRWDTSAQVFDEAVGAGMSSASRWLATGVNFPDALAAGPAVVAAGASFLLVPGDDLGAAPEIADRLAVDYCDLDRLVLLGGPGAITDQAVTQLESILPTDSSCTGDARSVTDCTAPPQTTLSEVINDLDPDGDPDGDGFTTGEETGTFAFDPVQDAARFNPLIADVPQIDIQLNGALTLVLQGSLSQTDSLAITTVEATERTDTTQNIDTTETTESHTAGGEAGIDSDGLSVGASYSYTNSTTNTTGTITTDEYREAQSQAVEQSTATTENVDSGSLSFEVLIANAGHVDFRMDDITINVTQLRRDGTRQIIGAASAEPGLVLNEDAPGTPQILTVEDISARGALDLARDLTGLEFAVSTFTLSEIGKGDVRTDEADFSQYQQRVRQNTAAVTIDTGPEGMIEDHFVSTTYVRNDDGTPAGTPLCEAIRVVLARDLQADARPTNINGNTDPLQVLTSLDQRIGNTDVDFTRDPATSWYWITDVGSPSIGNTLPFGLDQVNLRAGDAARLVFYQDSDGDGLARTREERELGTSDDNPDSDGDTIGDADEVNTPLTITVLNPVAPAPRPDQETYETYSDPTSGNVDGDGWDDITEVAMGTDPNRADTDGDRLIDDLDGFPLDGSRGAEAAFPLGYWPLDVVAPDNLQTLEFTFPDEEGTNDATAQQSTDGDGSNGAGPITDRDGNLGRAWAAGRPGDENNRGVVVAGNYPEDPNPDDTVDWYDDGFTIAAWFADSSRPDTNGVRLLAGEAGYMGLWLSGGTNGSLVIGPLPQDGSTPANLPGPLRYQSTQDLFDSDWRHAAGTAAPVTEGGVDGVRLTLFLNGEEVASEFYGDPTTPPTLENTGDRCAFVMGNFFDDCFGDSDNGTARGVGETFASPQTGIDDVYLFDSVLEELQVRDVYLGLDPSGTTR
ncbi:cell wall-binding repeat-containing protein [Euzebya rosea]|uniref:cell wall-binding repeat-containing protein n=1 Tax=Euzebya rosea TaxID=2052804 RepID=UPI000D3E435F|nr:cell wall-binding repeat-containing protein [Euzebya rosea]